jgi:hypothetical protein
LFPLAQAIDQYGCGSSPAFCQALSRFRPVA